MRRKQILGLKDENAGEQIYIYSLNSCLTNRYSEKRGKEGKCL